jgi:hypothetical protein
MVGGTSFGATGLKGVQLLLFQSGMRGFLQYQYHCDNLLVSIGEGLWESQLAQVSNGKGGKSL